ncbi:hypothetical protein BRC84_06470 [Halobacteriales archaeon QS_1_68_44]|nr:MAG: hypothetical protein BRC84_06470 [Halobacteriales archaeon QS_1_68_44]
MTVASRWLVTETTTRSVPPAVTVAFPVSTAKSSRCGPTSTWNRTGSTVSMSPSGVSYSVESVNCRVPARAASAASTSNATSADSPGARSSRAASGSSTSTFREGGSSVATGSSSVAGPSLTTVARTVPSSETRSVDSVPSTATDCSARGVTASVGPRSVPASPSSSSKDTVASTG